MSTHGRIPTQLQNVVRRGRIKLTTDDDGIQNAQIQFSDTETRDVAPMAYQYGVSSRPTADTDVIAVCYDGDTTRSVVIASNDLRVRFRNLAEGEVVVYDDLGQRIHLTRDGIVIHAPKGLTINGNVKVVGAIVATGDVTAGTVSLQNHVHEGVRAGTDLSGKPKP